ncbi:unnamed protein product [Hymenolepis diminuta]|uniref:Uncharacterized protein n=1 Tax=Hymenolepis diminuta TaxID=6216 RepID=A0A564Z2Q1_HYMDI|nr:unnamed protein product [Hymenolepis diminuta]
MLSDRRRCRQNDGFAVNTTVYACGYRLDRQWVAAIITNRHGILKSYYSYSSTRSQVKDQVMVLLHAARTRMNLLASGSIHPQRPMGEFPTKGDARKDNNYFLPLPVFLL